MRVLITGATGLVGRRLVERLASRGDEVRAISRDRQNARDALPQLASAHRPDDREAFSQVDAVIHLAGESVASRWTSKKKEAIERSRVEGTRALVDQLARANTRPKVLVSASAIGFYGDTGERAVSEDDRAADDFLARVCVGWEREAQRASDLGVRVVRVRIGLVLANDGGLLAPMLPLFRAGLGGSLGNGQQWWPWIDKEDLVRLIVFAVDDERVEGALNGVAPNPVRQSEFAQTLGRVLGRPALIPTPAFALKLALGEFATESLTSRRVLPKKAEALSFHFEKPELESSLRSLLRR